ncbi:RAB6-interacting golgin isoform X1 [Chelonoidis abingdonii]|uniref:RAB6-interacting golgin n=3 Tax=Chelonoidis abingdonii TaxID=106734 RepID=A0A8C0J1P2_CHEAB|nr:RAB6-interacting golgin isoform X3 [Chelonoidis abingdonii]
MAGGWAGFSEQELRRLRGPHAGTGRDTSESSDQQRRPPSVNKSRQQLLREKALKQQCHKLGLQDGAASVPPEQLLSVPKHKLCLPQQPLPPPPPSSIKDQRQHDTKDQQNAQGLENPCNGSENPQEFPVKMDFKLEKKRVELQEKSHWEVLQQEQRLMEEKNKRKKALLAKAIAERSRRTQAETVKLKRIQKELQALDDMVSADIGILRNRIDQASMDYSFARKRYDKAESEYVAAKLDFQRKTEIKERLTEHLCTIIQQNELRKAKKLEELMKQLEVEADEENLELEIEVEQMLQQQEVEAGRQAAQSQDLSQTAEENAVPCATAKENEHTGAASEQLVEQPGNSCSKSLSNMGSQNQSVNTTRDETPARSDTLLLYADEVVSDG